MYSAGATAKTGATAYSKMLLMATVDIMFGCRPAMFSKDFVLQLLYFHDLLFHRLVIPSTGNPHCRRMGSNR